MPTEIIHINAPEGVKSALRQQAKARGLCLGQYLSTILLELAAYPEKTRELYLEGSKHV